MGDDQFDFDGASNGSEGGEAGFGAGWEDDLETMLLKGMKKKAQRRIAMMAGMGVLGISIGFVVGLLGKNGLDSDSNTVVQGPSGGGGCTGTNCEGCTPMHGRDAYRGWTVACSGGQDVNCDGCYGGEVPLGQNDACPHNCICTVECDGMRGWDLNELVVGDDSLYAVHCTDGTWDGEEYCPPGSTLCRDSEGQALPEDRNTLCLNHDDCATDPCGIGGRCFDAVHNYTCACHEGFSGRNCEIDEDECAIGNPCNLQVRTMQSIGLIARKRRAML
eukprot:COSAG02_NODE_962_length_15608_cov_16.347692_3_plen_275_part_00